MRQSESSVAAAAAEQSGPPIRDSPGALAPDALLLPEESGTQCLTQQEGWPAIQVSPPPGEVLLGDANRRRARLATVSALGLRR